ncbi:MAG TPA: undecaprenyl-diphosphatase [Clostridiales bacterium]|nr:undecaprenyl-diphosphatase [Clostridiales bacterium]
MRYGKAVIVGLVQGLTEFLPVSSSGHLALLARLGIAPSSVFFNLTLHLATLCALLLVMRKEVLFALRHPIRGKGFYVVIASLPTVGVALLVKKLCPALLLGSMLGFGFVLTSVVLFLAETVGKGSKERELSGKISLLTGLAQGIAVLPGVSRSGTTIATLSCCGVERVQGAKFSFLLSIPVIVGGFLSEGMESGFSAAGASFPEIALSAAAAFISGVIAVRFMLNIVKKGLKPFIPYTFALGILCYFLP